MCFVSSVCESPGSRGSGICPRKIWVTEIDFGAFLELRKPTYES